MLLAVSTIAIHCGSRKIGSNRVDKIIKPIGDGSTLYLNSLLSENESDVNLYTIRAIPGCYKLLKSMFKVIFRYPSEFLNPREEASPSQPEGVASLPGRLPDSCDLLCNDCSSTIVTSSS